MSKKKINWQKIISPMDFLTFFVVLIGVIIALYIDEIAIKLIGVSVAILAGVALIMQISQRLSEIVDTKFEGLYTPTASLNLITQENKDAVRTTVEGFEEEFGSEADDKAKTEKQSLDKIDEGFSIKGTADKKKILSVTEPLEKEKVPESKPKIEEKPKRDTQFADEFSGMKIIGKVKKDKVETTIPVEEDNKQGEQQRLPIEEPIPEPIEFEDSNTFSEPDEQEDEITHEFIKSKLDIPISDLMDDISTLSNEPRKEFEYFISRVLTLIRSVLNTKTAVFLLVDSEKNDLIIESISTDQKELFIREKKISIGNDIVSQIVNNKKPEILTITNPSAELDLIPYYNKSAGVKTFIGVPVYYNFKIIGVLCADTDKDVNFNKSSVGFLGHFTKLIAAMVHSYTGKYDLIQSSKTLEAITSFSKLLEHDVVTMNEVSEAVVESLSQMIECQTIGLCGYDENKSGWVIKSLHTKSGTGILLGKLVDLGASLIGDAIVTEKPYLVAPLTNEHIRFASDEKRKSGGVFLAVPLKSNSGTFGAIFLEDKNANALSTLDLPVIETIADQASKTIEKLYFMDMLRTNMLIDHETGLYNIPSFLRRIEEELYRNVEHVQVSTLVAFQIDKYQSFDPQKHSDRYEQMVFNVINSISTKLRPYDIFGKLDNDTYGIMFINRKINDAKLTAEKIRKEIAIAVMDINNNSFSVTLSMGLAETSKINSVDGLIDHANLALGVSIQKKNTVSIYS